MRGPESLAVNARSRSFSKYPGLSERMCKLLLAIHASTAAKAFERVEGGRKILLWETMPMNSWMHGHGIAHGVDWWNQSIPLPVREIRCPRGANKSAGWNPASKTCSFESTPHPDSLPGRDGEGMNGARTA